MLQIHHRRVGDVTILDLEGRVTPGDAEHACGRAVTTAVRAGCRKLLLNLTKTTSTDTAGISVLVGALVTMREAGGRLGLLRIDRRYAQLLTVVALYTHFEVFFSEEEALSEFGVPHARGMRLRETSVARAEGLAAPR
jgi:anti-sigma B factor antagonist